MTEQIKNDLKKKKEIKPPTTWGLVGYIIVISLLGLLAVFSRQLAQGIEGPVLCIYVAVLPKYIFGLALILAGVDGAVYAIRFFRHDRWIPMTASGVQIIALIVFLFLIFPLAIKEGVPAEQTYNLMRLLIGVMLFITVWDFISELRKFLKTKKEESDI